MVANLQEKTWEKVSFSRKFKKTFCLQKTCWFWKVISFSKRLLTPLLFHASASVWQISGAVQMFELGYDFSLKMKSSGNNYCIYWFWDYGVYYWLRKLLEGVKKTTREEKLKLNISWGWLILCTKSATICWCRLTTMMFVFVFRKCPYLQIN